MYHQYNIVEEIIDCFWTGGVISGFVSPSLFGTKILIAYGNKQQNGKMNIVAFDTTPRGEKMTHIGLSFSFYEMEVDQRDRFNCSVTKTEAKIINYCLMLPFVDDSKKEFSRQFAVIFDDW